MTQYLFYFLSFVAIFCGLMTVLSRNPIHSVIYLIGCFFSIAGHYLLLNAQFLAVVHVVVYAGAIMVLFLFTLMLMNLNEETEKHKPAIARGAAAIAAGLLMFVVIAAVQKLDQMPLAQDQPVDLGSIKNLGRLLVNESTLPFDFVSVLFLRATVGAVLLAKKDKTQLAK